MAEINKKILEMYGIYGTRKLKVGEQEKLQKIKKQIEKLIYMKVERLYVVNESAWGKEPDKERYTICILIDKRVKDLEKIQETLANYAKKENIEIILWTLCQFEKRKNVPTEDDYYIERYGIKVYDSEKQPDINENVQTTEYAAHMNNYKSVRSYIQDNPDFLMMELVRIYILKIGYAVIGKTADLERDCNFAKLVSNDEKINQIIDQYLKQTQESEKNKILDQFEKYIKNIKQIKFPMKLEEKPTMNVYEKLLQKKQREGTLDIKTLTKEDLYIMYLIQNKNTFEIAELYGVENKKISAKRDNWNIKLREKSLIDEKNIINRSIEQFNTENPEYTYALLKQSGMMDFEKYLFQILKYTDDGGTYLLKEFWQFVKKEDTELDTMLFNRKTNAYYKISMGVDLLLQNELIEEVDFKQYKITQRGKELLWYCDGEKIEQISIPTIYSLFKEVKYYDLYYTDKCPTEYEQMIWEEANRRIQIEENEKKTEDNELKEKEKEEEEIKEEVSIQEQVTNLKQIEIIEESKDIQKIKTKRQKESTKPVKIDFNKINEAKTDFGRKCEEIIYEYEKQRLIREGREDKANEVIWASKEIGDGLGYDIESFENQNGTYEKIYIEVKGTDKKDTEPFDVTINEILVSEKYKEKYYIYRIAKANTKNPVFYKVKGSISENFELTAVKFKAIRKANTNLM